MVFSSTIFVFIFLPCTLIATLFFKNITLKNLILLVASLVFYSWGEPVYVFLFVATILINWILTLIADKIPKRKKTIGITTICLDVAILFWFKYAGWLGSLSGLSLPQVVLPVGISFYTFQAISYVADVTLMEKYKADKSIINVGLYISFFPQLIAGPIVRYEEMKDQIQKRKMTFILFEEGSFRFLFGICKKVLLADSMGIIVNKAFSDSLSASFLFAWLGAIAYTLQIYFDFSGYSDMAIGLGKMFGFNIPENFKNPYISRSIRDFWRRWHITLSIWFRDYVYIPLGGNQKGKWRTVFNITVVWLLTGIWHGANFTFIIWGAIYGILVLFEKNVHIEEKINRGGVPAKLLYRLFTLLMIVLLWVIFRSENIGQALNYICNMFRVNLNNKQETLLYFSEYKFAFLGCIALIILPYEKMRCAKSLMWPIILLAFCISIAYIVKGTYSPFLYFHF